MRRPQLSAAEIVSGLDDLDALAHSEYSVGLLDLQDEPARLRRLAGVTIKRPFAIPVDATTSVTGAQHAWLWTPELLGDGVDTALPEYELLDDIREWGGFGPAPSGFDLLVAQAETERGLFKIAALWLQDRIRGREPQSARAYYGAAESNRFSSLLDAADFLATFALTPVYVAAFPAGWLAIPFLLIAAKFGYHELFEPGEEPDMGEHFAPEQEPPQA